MTVIVPLSRERSLGDIFGGMSSGRGGPRVAGLDRSGELCLRGCLVCPKPLDISFQKSLPKGLEIEGLPRVYVCSRGCAVTLGGRRRLTGKGARSMARYHVWATRELGTTLRVDHPVEVFHDYSPGRLVDAGAGVIVALRFDTLAECVEFSVKYVGDRKVVKVGLRGLKPRRELQTLVREIRPTQPHGEQDDKQDQDSQRRATEQRAELDDKKLSSFALAADSAQKGFTAANAQATVATKKRDVAETERDAAVVGRDEADAKRRKSDESAATDRQGRAVAEAELRTAEAAEAALELRAAEAEQRAAEEADKASSLAVEREKAQRNTRTVRWRLGQVLSETDDLKASGEAALKAAQSRSLTSVLGFLSPDGLAARLLKTRSLDALTTSNSTLQTTSRRCADLKRAVVASTVVFGSQHVFQKNTTIFWCSRYEWTPSLYV
jgi:hypothetical protein